MRTKGGGGEEKRGRMEERGSWDGVLERGVGGTDGWRKEHKVRFIFTKVAGQTDINTGMEEKKKG